MRSRLQTCLGLEPFNPPSVWARSAPNIRPRIRVTRNRYAGSTQLRIVGDIRGAYFRWVRTIEIMTYEIWGQVVDEINPFPRSGRVDGLRPREGEDRWVRFRPRGWIALTDPFTRRSQNATRDGAGDQREANDSRRRTPLMIRPINGDPNFVHLVTITTFGQRCEQASFLRSKPSFFGTGVRSSIRCEPSPSDPIRVQTAS